MANASASLKIPNMTALADFADRLASVLQPGDLIALNGTLGAGKTTLTQQVGRALGIAERIVSPTFTLMHEYGRGAMPMVHVDLYRLGIESADSLSEELLSVLESGHALVMVEWADYGAAFLTPYVTWDIRIEVDSDDIRTLHVMTPKKQKLETMLHAG